MSPIEQVIGIVAGAINCKNELTVFIRAAARLLDPNVAEGAGMKPHSRQASIGKPFPDFADRANDFR